MKRRHILLGVLSAAALVFSGAPSMASATTTHSGAQHFLILENDDGPQVIVANGPIHASGVDVAVNNNRDRFEFPKGNVRIWHQAKTDHQSYDKKTCLTRFSETGVYEVLGGSGAYRGATGHGTYVLRGVGVGCSSNGPPTVFQLRIVAQGPISY
jgi:hypothetical protein